MSTASLLSRSCIALVPALALVSLALDAPSAHAQAALTFSGGNGTPLSFTIGAPITYTITSAPFNQSPFFIFDGVGGDLFYLTPVSGNITFSVNGGAAQSLNTIRNGYPSNQVTPDDFIAYGSTPGVFVGDVIVLNAGTLTTTDNFAGAAPTSGLYNTFVTSNNGGRISSNGTSSVPEPSTGAVMGMGLAAFALCGLTIRARRKAGTKVLTASEKLQPTLLKGVNLS